MLEREPRSSGPKVMDSRAAPLSPTVRRGIPRDLVPDVAGLLVQAFPLKVQHELRPRTPEQAKRLIAESIDRDLGWFACDRAGAVAGVVGVNMPRRSFHHMDFKLLRREFGFLGAMSRWVRAAAGGLVARPRTRQWRIEVLAVAEAMRGRGVGTRLLETVIEAARGAGMRSLGLEVVDINDRALKLYELMGFRRVFTLPTGRLTARGGYRGVRFMRLDL